MAARAVCTPVAVAPVARAVSLRPAQAKPAPFVSNATIKKTSAMQGERDGGLWGRRGSVGGDADNPPSPAPCCFVSRSVDPREQQVLRGARGEGNAGPSAPLGPPA